MPRTANDRLIPAPARRFRDFPRRRLAVIVAVPLTIFLLAPPRPSAAQGQPVIARNGMVVAGEEAAARVGVDLLEAGGNAFDAAAGVAFALAVTFPEAGNLGGGGFAVMLAPDRESPTPDYQSPTTDRQSPTRVQKPLALDFRETAPAAAHRDLYLDDVGNVIPDASLYSYLAVGTPGTVDGLLRLHSRFGKLDRADILAPAIAMAEEGIRVSPWLARRLESHRDVLTTYPETAEIFFPDGRPLDIGDLLRQPALARTLRRIADEGRDGFYSGPVAEAIAAQVQAGGGILTTEDLAAYEAKWRDPLTFTAGDYTFVTHPLPSSGGITLAQILGLLDLDRLARTPWHSADYIRRIVEAERLAYADRNYHLGDTDFVDVPVAALMSETYLADRRELMPETGSGDSKNVTHGEPLGTEAAAISSDEAAAQNPNVRARHESEETTHLCVVDSHGNVVAMTITLNAAFGMGAVVAESGFFLNNEMDDFSAKPGVPNLYGLIGAEANAIAPGKRMLSSMTPAIILRDGDFWMTVGTPGGSTIITTVLQIFLNSSLYDMNIRDAIDAPRFHHQWLPDTVFHEPRAFGPETAGTLEEMSYRLAERDAIGIAAGIRRGDDGLLTGAADRRGDGLAVGY